LPALLPEDLAYHCGIIKFFAGTDFTSILDPAWRLLALDVNSSISIDCQTSFLHRSRLGSGCLMKPLANPLPAFDPIPQRVIEAAKRLFLAFTGRTQAS
jgi:hypothetical protein